MSTRNSVLFSSSILIIDDNESNADTLKEMLELAGFFAVNTLNDARTAITSIKKIKPTLVILDLHMPHFSGLALLEQMNLHRLINDKIAVIMLTGDSDITAKVTALRLGASDFITKPFSFLEVQTRIQNLLQKQLLFVQLESQNLLLTERVHERTAALLHINDTILEQNKKLKKLTWMQSHVIRAPLARFMSIISLLVTDESLLKEEFQQLLKKSLVAAHEVDHVILEMSQLAWEAQLMGQTEDNPEDFTSTI
jgi:DNA-binding response OmpR family regulator